LQNSIKLVLKNQVLFSGLDDQTLDNLALQFTTKVYNKGQYVFQQWDEASRLYILLTGQVSIEMHGNDGKTIKIMSLDSGNIFGEYSILDNLPRSASVVVTQQAKLASISGLSFQNLLDSEPSLARNMLRVLVGHIRKSNGHIESIVSLSLLQRTAEILLSMSEKDGKLLRITQKELSQKLYASREKVNAKLKKLETRGAIKRGHQKIEILSESILKNMITAI